MKEVFQHADSALVGLYQTILEDADITTFVRNLSTLQTPVAGLATAVFPLPLFFPSLCVVNDDDYAEAMSILAGLKQAFVAPETVAEWHCPQCGETVPGNFTNCWNCQSPKDVAGAGVA